MAKPDRAARSIAFATLLAAMPPIAAEAQPVSRAWGTAEASRIIESCLESLGFGNQPVGGTSCTDQANEACLAVTGNNQSLLNECARDTMLAWSGVIEDLTAQASALAPEGKSAEFGTAAQTWQRSADADCSLVRSVWERGSLQPYEYARCHSIHASRRAEDLAYLILYWGNLR